LYGYFHPFKILIGEVFPRRAVSAVKRTMPAKRRTFSAQDDVTLLKLVSDSGTDDWRSIASGMKDAFTPRQCRERWKNYVDPKLVRTAWSEEEDRMLAQEYNRVGPRWIAIARMFGDRSANALRNRMSILIRKQHRKSSSSPPPPEPVEPVPLPPPAPPPQEQTPDQTNSFLSLGAEAQASALHREELMRMFFSGE
jgi:hypothetical protein